MSSYRPNKKVSAAGIGGAISVLVIWTAQQFGAEIPGDVGAAIGTLCAFGLGWLVPSE